MQKCMIGFFFLLLKIGGEAGLVEARRRLLTLRFSDGSACGCSRLCVEADDCCGEAYACYEEGSG